VEEIREEVSIGLNAYNPYQIPSGPLAPGGPRIRKTTVSPAQTPPTLRLIWRVFRALNATNPDLTQDCWLCLNPEPSDYVGLGVDAIFGSEELDIKNLTQTKIENNKSVCLW
jgi:hypothetical protein